MARYERLFEAYFAGHYMSQEDIAEMQAETDRRVKDMKERPQVDEVLVRDKELDVPYFLPKAEAEKKAKKGEVVIVKNDPKSK